MSPNKTLNRAQNAAAAGMVIPVVCGLPMIMQPSAGLIFHNPIMLTLAAISLLSAVILAITVALDFQGMDERSAIATGAIPSKEEWEAERLARTLEATRTK